MAEKSTKVDLLADLTDELARGSIYECSLRSKKWQHDGLLDGQTIYVDPRPSILETLIHELLHRMKPRWGEKKVTSTAKALVLSMDEPTRIKWYKAYNKVKKKVPPVTVEDST